MDVVDEDNEYESTYEVWEIAADIRNHEYEEGEYVAIRYGKKRCYL